MPRPNPKPQPESRVTVVPLEVVAEFFGISKQRCAQIEQNALRKVRAEMARRGLKPEDLLPG